VSYIDIIGIIAVIVVNDIHYVRLRVNLMMPMASRGAFTLDSGGMGSKVKLSSGQILPQHG